MSCGGGQSIDVSMQTGVGVLGLSQPYKFLPSARTVYTVLSSDAPPNNQEVQAQSALQYLAKWAVPFSGGAGKFWLLRSLTILVVPGTASGQSLYWSIGPVGHAFDQAWSAWGPLGLTTSPFTPEADAVHLYPLATCCLNLPVAIDIPWEVALWDSSLVALQATGSIAIVISGKSRTCADSECGCAGGGPGQFGKAPPERGGGSSGGTKSPKYPSTGVKPTK
jgi:hypothetical protein